MLCGCSRLSTCPYIYGSRATSHQPAVSLIHNVSSGESALFILQPQIDITIFFTYLKMPPVLVSGLAHLPWFLTGAILKVISKSSILLIIMEF